MAKVYEKCEPKTVAFIGLGTMGYPMAGHLAKAGHRVTVLQPNNLKGSKVGFGIYRTHCSNAHAKPPKMLTTYSPVSAMTTISEVLYSDVTALLPV